MTQDEMMQSDQSTPSCQNLPGLTTGQSRICHLYIDHMNAVALGAKTALTECKHQFHGRRWNCSILDDVNVLGPVLNMGKFGWFNCCRCLLIEPKVIIVLDILSVGCFADIQRFNYRVSMNAEI